LVKYIPRGRFADLDDVVVVPIAVDAHVVRPVGEKIDCCASSPFILVFIFASGLGTCPFPWLDLTEPWPSTHHAASGASINTVVLDDEKGNASSFAVLNKG
jgi:hypothetical protein